MSTQAHDQRDASSALSGSGSASTDTATATAAPASALSPTDLAALRTLRRHYFALVPPYLLRVPSAAQLAPPAAQAYLVRGLLGEDDHDDGTEAGPSRALPQPEAGYARGFWRRVLPVIEKGVQAAGEVDEDAAVDERIYEAVAALMAAPGAVAAGPPAQSHKTFLYDAPSAGRSSRTNDSGDDFGDLNERAVTLLEEQVAVQAGTTGLRTWTAALHLAHHCLHSPAVLFGGNGEIPPIVEIGAGTGLLSIVLAQMGADVRATDLGGDGDGEQEEEGGSVWRTPLARLKANIALNSDTLATPPVACELDWARARSPPAERGTGWTNCLAPVSGRRRTVLAADVIYDPDIVPLLVDTVRELLAPVDGATAEQQPAAIIAATVRNEETFALFLRRCAERGLRTETLQLEPMDAENPTFWDTALDAGTRVEVVRITRSGGDGDE